MNYSAMIQNRRSVRAFREKEVPSEAIGQLRSYNAAKLFFCKVFKGYFPLPPLLESQKQRLFYAI